MSEVIRGLSGTDCPLGVIPAGTANILAKELGIPPDPLGAVRAALAGEVREMDLLRVNGRLAAMVTSAGLDAAVTRWMARSRRGHIGYLNYLEGIRRAFEHYSRPPMEVEVDGEVLGTFYQVIVTNARLYGGLFRLAPEACLDDGLLEVFGFAGRERHRVYKHFATMIAGCHRRLDDVRHRQGRSVEVRAGEAVPYQVDGDFVGTGPVTVEVAPLALHVVAPRWPIPWCWPSRRGGPWCRRDTRGSARENTASDPHL